MSNLIKPFIALLLVFCLHHSVAFSQYSSPTSVGFGSSFDSESGRVGGEADAILQRTSVAPSVVMHRNSAQKARTVRIRAALPRAEMGALCVVPWRRESYPRAVPRRKCAWQPHTVLRPSLFHASSVRGMIHARPGEKLSVPPTEGRWFVVPPDRLVITPRVDLEQISRVVAPREPTLRRNFCRTR
jgi:hypothetical protein